MHAFADYIMSIDPLSLTVPVSVGFGVGLLITVVVLFHILRKLRAQIIELQTNAETQLNPVGGRYRKRDKLALVGRTMLRRMSGSFSDVKVHRRIKQRFIRARKMLHKPRIGAATKLVAREAPASVLEADTLAQNETSLPPEVIYMIRSIRMFGHFERPLFLEVCRRCVSRFVPAGVYVFRPGMADNNIFIVQHGHLKLFITDNEGRDNLVNDVYPGETIISLLSVIDVLTGNTSPYKTVSAKAAVDTTILCLPAEAFSAVFQKYPESLVRMVQIIMVRLQRVTFLALHEHLGFTAELINQDFKLDKNFNVHKFATQHSQYKRDRSGSDDRDSDSAGGNVVTTPKVCRRGSNPEPIGGDFEAACGRARVQVLGSSPGARSSSGAVDTAMSMGFGNLGPIREASLSFSADPKPLEIIDDDEQLLDMGKQDLANLLDLSDSQLLDNKIILANIIAGTVMVKQGDTDANLFFIVSGQLHLCEKDKRGHDRTIYVANPGDLEGPLAVLTGDPQLFTMKARQECKCIIMSKVDFYNLMRECPEVVLPVARCIVRRMSPFVRQIDFALDWAQTEAGRSVYRQGDRSDSIYMILSGRLRSVASGTDGKKRLVGEYGRGDLVGLVEVLTQSVRATSVHAVRDTEMAQLPEGLVNFIKLKHPQVVTRLIHLLGQRILGQITSPMSSSHQSLVEGSSTDHSANLANLSTVAVIPVNDNVPVSSFTLELVRALTEIGSAVRLTSAMILDTLGPHALDSIHEYRLSNWLGQQEDAHRIVLYQADTALTPWTHRCIRQADCILIVGCADTDPGVSKLERQLEHTAVRAQKELVLLHRDWEHPIRAAPKETIKWLNVRSWCTSHHHIRCPRRVFTRRSPVKLLDMYQKIFATPADPHSDFSRLARFLTGTSVGLVLGGGGARGISQVGIIKAIKEAGIPIDMVGGTSIGSFMGALYGGLCHNPIDDLIKQSRAFSDSMTSMVKRLYDLTYPMTSFFSGSQFNRAIDAVFEDKQIEDLWIPYFCITTDISSSRMRVHTTGSLWRYCRASMSLSGYLPPMCDPDDGHLLLDGGYVNNLPADVMRSFGCKTVIAIDVGSQDLQDLTNYGDALSGWWLLWKRWNPWASPVRIPDMHEIQSRLAYVSCVKQLEEVKTASYVRYVRPPIDRFHTLQFGSYNDIYTAGYQHGKAVFDTWRTNTTPGVGALPPVGPSEPATLRRRPSIDLYAAANRFTDLAELISRIDKPRVRRDSSVLDSDSDASSSAYEDVIDGEEIDDEEDDLADSKNNIDDDLSLDDDTYEADKEDDGRA